jgi:hypothetical protein
VHLQFARHGQLARLRAPRQLDESLAQRHGGVAQIDLGFGRVRAPDGRSEPRVDLAGIEQRRLRLRGLQDTIDFRARGSHFLVGVTNSRGVERQPAAQGEYDRARE